jgi:pimeloyl-ACP methyl ester carboxylesterase
MASPVDKLTPTDPRVTHEYADLNGIRYHYLHASPSAPTATVFLIHGWPDFSFGWRAQIPFLLSLNLRVIAPDMIGYGLTAAPTPLSYYTFKRAADDLAALAAHLAIPRIILLGHDWGGAIAYRVALWKPALVRALVSVCTPYARPSLRYIPTEDLVAGPLPQFAYQLALAGGAVEAEIREADDVRGFINAVFGARTASGEVGFDVRSGPDFAVIKGGRLQRTPLLSEEELEHYVRNYMNTGMRGTVNWYRTRQLNWEEELPLARRQEREGLRVEVPTMFVAASRDDALPEGMSRGMEGSFVELRREKVDGGHWILVQKSEECNRIIGGFLEDILSREGGGEENKKKGGKRESVI